MWLFGNWQDGWKKIYLYLPTIFFCENLIFLFFWMQMWSFVFTKAGIALTIDLSHEIWQVLPVSAQRIDFKMSLEHDITMKNNTSFYWKMRQYLNERTFFLSSGYLSSLLHTIGLKRYWERLRHPTPFPKGEQTVKSTVCNVMSYH